MTVGKNWVTALAVVLQAVITAVGEEEERVKGKRLEGRGERSEEKKEKMKKLVQEDSEQDKVLNAPRNQSCKGGGKERTQASEARERKRGKRQVSEKRQRERKRTTSAPCSRRQQP
jgi:hypothetical protein